MKQHEIDLLTREMCARTPTGLICSTYREDDEGVGWRDAECKGFFQNGDSYEFYFENVIAVDNIEHIKPYLRPMSDITEEESKELALLQVNFYIDGWMYPIAATAMIEWLNSHHFDYIGLIGLGLALKAKENMYK